MTARIRIEVTADDIAKGTPEDPGSCPVALACERLGFRHPLIDAVDLEFSGAIVVPTPSSVKAFIERFDAGMSVEPFAFEVELDGAEMDAKRASLS